MKGLIRNTALILVLALTLPVFAAGCGKKNSDKGDGSWYDAKTLDIKLRYDDSEYGQLTSDVVGLIGDKIIVHVNYYKDMPDGFDYVNGDRTPYQGDSVEIYDLEGKFLKSYNCKEFADQKDIPGVVSVNMHIAGDKLMIPYESFDDRGQVADVVAFVDIESGKVTGTYETEPSDKYIREFVTSGGYTAYCFGKRDDMNFQEIEIVSEDGSKKAVPFKGTEAAWDSGYPIIDTGDAKIVVPYMKLQSGVWTGISYYLVDLKTATVKDSGDDMMWAGGFDYAYSASWVKDLGVVCADEDGLFKLDFEGKKTERILDYDRCDANLYLLRRLKLFRCENGRYIFGGKVYTENYTEFTDRLSVIILQRSDNDPTAGKTELTAASFDILDYNTAEAVRIFNQNSSKYHLSFDPQYYLANITDYRQHDSEENADLKSRMRLVDKLKVDILAGEGPDIILNSISETGSLESVIFADLSGDIKADGCFGNIFEACKNNGKLYTVPLSFQLSGICTDSVYVKDGQTGFTFEEYKDFVKNVCNGTDPHELENTEYFTYIFSVMYDTFIKAGTDPDFNMPEFQALAEYVRGNVTYTPPEEPGYTVKTIDDKTHAVCQTFSTVLAYASVFDHTTHKTVVMGEPTAAGTGPVFNIINSVAVSASSKNKEGAVEFIKLLLSEDMQLAYAKTGFSMPVNISSYEESSKTMIGMYNVERDKMIEKGFSAQDLLNLGYPYAISTDEVKNFEDIIKTGGTVYRYDPAVLVIMREEMPAYFKGQKSLDQVIVIINSRVKTYLSERTK